MYFIRNRETGAILGNKFFYTIGGIKLSPSIRYYLMERVAELYGSGQPGSSDIQQRLNSLNAAHYQAYRHLPINQRPRITDVPEYRELHNMLTEARAAERRLWREHRSDPICSLLPAHLELWETTPGGEFMPARLVLDR